MRNVRRFFEQLGSAMWLCDEGEDNTLVDVFHSNRQQDALHRIPLLFSNICSNLRVVISTIAFRMGMDVPDIVYVLHWGPSENILMYWQEVGSVHVMGGVGKP